MRDEIYPSLSAEALRVFQGAQNIVVKSSGIGDGFGGSTGIVNVRIGNILVGTDPQGEVWLHFSKSLPERYIPAWKLLEGEVDPKLVKGQIVFLGTSAKGLLDLRFSPLGDMIPGVEVHTQLVEQMIQGTWLIRPDWDKAAVVLFLIGMWALLLFLVSRAGVLWSVLLGAGAVGGTVCASWYAFTEARLFFDPLFPSLTIIGIFLACSISRHFLRERERRWIKDAFSSYVSPNLVRHLMKNPNQLTLGGENRECAFVFTDLAGFTSLMEESEPSVIASLLNSYLDEMVRIAFRYNGTLDRFVGDAVAVMFSAPIYQPDHAARALACAKEMDTFARGFASARQAEGISFGKTRIGVHTGVVLVGNFGGKTMLDYRALGDPINTAARLERVNKHLGTHICVSGVTAGKCPGFIGRPAGILVLKGKSQGLEAFEPLTREEAESPAVKAYIEAYRLMKNKNPKALEAFKALAREYPDDPLANYHFKRLERGETGSIVVMTEK
jgi:adenylate cyclase